VYNFTAYRWKDTTYFDFDEFFECKTGEVLTSCLNLDLTEFERKHLEFKDRKLRRQVMSPFQEHAEKGAYSKNVWEAQAYFSYLDEFAQTLLPYKKIIVDEPYHNELIRALNDFPQLFEGGGDGELREFEPVPYAASLMSDAGELTNAVVKLFERYAQFAEDVLRVRYVYAKFLEDYFHVGSAFPTPGETAAAFEKFTVEVLKKGAREDAPHKKLALSKTASSYYTIRHITENGRNSRALCEVTEYSNISALLNHEFFEGMKTGALPKRCACCGRYFLLTDGYYSDFCEDAAPGEETRTCREMGARRRFGEKVKSDPVWLAHQRAYKAHYARYMRKKMSESEFLEWSRMSQALRDKALNGEMEFAAFERIIKI
jgi:hypothetical protein